jgi:hypothetical protein
MAIKLGNKVRDTLTGFTGIVTSRTEYLYGCVHIGVTPEDLDKDGKVKQAEFFDEQRIEVIKSTKPQTSQDSAAKAGGPAILGRPARR